MRVTATPHPRQRVGISRSAGLPERPLAGCVAGSITQSWCLSPSICEVGVTETAASGLWAEGGAVQGSGRRCSRWLSSSLSVLLAATTQVELSQGGILLSGREAAEGDDTLPLGSGTEGQRGLSEGHCSAERGDGRNGSGGPTKASPAFTQARPPTIWRGLCVPGGGPGGPGEQGGGPGSASGAAPQRLGSAWFRRAGER